MLILNIKYTNIYKNVICIWLIIILLIIKNFNFLGSILLELGNFNRESSNKVCIYNRRK